jgi:hypothetical protein
LSNLTFEVSEESLVKRREQQIQLL